MANMVSAGMPDSKVPVGLAPLERTLVCPRPTLVPEVWATDPSLEPPIPQSPVSLHRDSGLLTLTPTILIIGRVSGSFSLFAIQNQP